MILHRFGKRNSDSGDDEDDEYQNKNEHMVNIVSWPLVAKRISEENVDSIIIPLGKYVLKIVTH